MPTPRFFCDAGAITLELFQPEEIPADVFESQFPQAKSPDRGFTRRIGHTAAGEVRPVTRAVIYHTTSRPHRCTASCKNARSEVARCECSCGGRNHGRGNA